MTGRRSPGAPTRMQRACEKSMADNLAEIPELPSEQAIDRLVSLLERPGLAGLPRRVRDGPRHPRQRPRPDARPADDPGLPGRLARGQQAPRPAVPAALEGPYGLRPARDRAGLPDRPMRGGRRRR